MVNKFYITAGLPPNDNGNESGVNKFYISAGLVPDDTAVGGVENSQWYFEMLNRRNR